MRPPPTRPTPCFQFKGAPSRASPRQVVSGDSPQTGLQGCRTTQSSASANQQWRTLELPPPCDFRAAPSGIQRIQRNPRKPASAHKYTAARIVRDREANTLAERPTTCLQDQRKPLRATCRGCAPAWRGTRRKRLHPERQEKQRRSLGVEGG